MREERFTWGPGELELVTEGPEAEREPTADEWSESDHPRGEGGQFGEGGGGAPAAKPEPSPAAKPARKGFSSVETKPIPKAAGRPGGGAGAQLPEHVQTRLKALGVSKLPAAHIADVHVSDRLGDDKAAHKGALLVWKDDKGREQRAYTAEFDKTNAQKKWARVLANRPKIEAAIGQLGEKALASPAHAAALLIAHTGLRPGSDESVKATGHYGATTMEARHVSFTDGEAHIEYVGKAGKVNKATVTDDKLVAALRKNVGGPPPKAPGERVFNVPRDAVAAAAPSGVKLKDFRTTVATVKAERLLSTMKPALTGNDKKDARQIIGILKQVSTDVSKTLNNTPAMARRSYIAPQIIQAWAAQHGLKEEWIQ